MDLAEEWQRWDIVTWLMDRIAESNELKVIFHSVTGLMLLLATHFAPLRRPNNKSVQNTRRRGEEIMS